LFLFGKNNEKQLGVNDVDNISTITNDILNNFKINPKKIKKMSCGNNHNLILIKTGLIKKNKKK
jgi:alpha-tubulin suppressor-like RCC1 family protein